MSSEIPSQDPKKGLSIASLVCGIVGLIATVLGCFGLPISLVCGLAAIITGHKSMAKCKKQPTEYGGKGMAIAGLVMGYITIGLGILVGVFTILAFFALAAAGSGSGSF